MNGRGIVIDTNAIIHFVAGTMPTASAAHLEGKEFHISFITEIEVRSFRKMDQFRERTSSEFLPGCTIHGVSEVLKDEAVRLRMVYGLKTPDAIIAATATVFGLPLMTGDKGLKRLDKELELIFVKYD